MTHYHFIVWCAEGKTPDGYAGVTYVDLICATPEEALARARQLVPEHKAFYVINSIVEHHDHAEATVFAPGRNGKV